MSLDYAKLRIEIKSYIVPLDDDPSSNSLNILHEKANQIKGFRDRLRCILLDARKNVRDNEEALGVIARNYKKRFNEELSKDNVKILKTIAQQNAFVEMMLQLQINEVATAEIDYNRSVDFFNDTKDVLNDLLDTSRTLRDQIHIIDQQITIGEISHASIVERKRDKTRLNISNTVTKSCEKFTNIGENNSL